MPSAEFHCQYIAPLLTANAPKQGFVDMWGNLRVRSGPAEQSIAVNVSSSDQTLTTASRALYIGSGGNLTVRLVGDSADSTYSNLAAGTVYPLACSIIRTSGATASGIVALL